MSGQKAGRLDVTEPDAAVSSSSVSESERDASTLTLPGQRAREGAGGSWKAVPMFALALK